MSVSEHDLHVVCDMINRRLGTPANPVSGSQWQVGNYHLDHAYGRVALHRVVSENGAVTDPFRMGHMPKRELMCYMRGFVAALDEVSCLI